MIASLIEIMRNEIIRDFTIPIVTFLHWLFFFQCYSEEKIQERKGPLRGLWTQRIPAVQETPLNTEGALSVSSETAQNNNQHMESKKQLAGYWEFQGAYQEGKLNGQMWFQGIYSPTIAKEDLVVCTQIGEIVEATIKRQKPEGERERHWKFHGVLRDGELFGHFSTGDPKDPSFGTIFMTQQARTTLKVHIQKVIAIFKTGNRYSAT